MKKGKFIILSGPSGVGKDTLINKVLPKLNNFAKVITATSRPPRKGEVNGRHYYFFSKKEFANRIKSGYFVEYVKAHGDDSQSDYYGTPKKELTKLNKGINLILNIEVVGAEKIKKHYPDCVRIFIKPKNLKQLEKQLLKRGKETEERIKKRIKRAKFELAKAKDYDYQIINYYENLDKAAAKLEQLLINLTK